MCRSDKKNDLDILNKAEVLGPITCSTDGHCNISTAKIRKAEVAPHVVYDALVRLVGRKQVSIDENTLRVEKEGRAGVYSVARTVGYTV